MKTAEILLSLFAAATLTACGGDDNDGKWSGNFGQVEVPDTRELEQTVGADDTQGKSGVTFTTEAAWTAAITQTRAGTPDWISISPDHGDAAGTYTLRITLTPNGSEEERTATITIECGNSTVPITLTQEGTDNPITPVPNSRISRIECDVMNNYSPSHGEDRMIYTYRFMYDDAGRVIAYLLDRTPEDETDEAEETVTFNYADATTLNINITNTTVAPEYANTSYTVTLDAAGRAIEAHNDNYSSAYWTFVYNEDGYCTEYTQSGVGIPALPRATCSWTEGNLTALDSYNILGDKVPESCFSFDYFPGTTNRTDAMSLDLNAWIFNICPALDNNELPMGMLLAGIGRLGGRSACLTKTTRNEKEYLVDKTSSEEDFTYFYHQMKDEQVEWNQQDGRVDAVTCTRSFQTVAEYYNSNNEVIGREVLDGEDFSNVDTYRIFY